MTIEFSKKRSILKKETTKLPSRKQGVTAYSANPFWETTEVNIGKKRVTIGGGQHIDEDGVSTKLSGIHVVQEVDSEGFVKIFTKNVRSIFDLKPTTQRVLQYLMVELQKTPNAESVYLAWFGAEEYFSAESLNVSRTSFQRAMKELLLKGFIAESTKANQVWINPQLIFNGDRMTFINEYRMKSKRNLFERTEGDEHLQQSLIPDS